MWPMTSNPLTVEFYEAFRAQWTVTDSWFQCFNSEILQGDYKLVQTAHQHTARETYSLLIVNSLLRGKYLPLSLSQRHTYLSNSVWLSSSGAQMREECESVRRQDFSTDLALLLSGSSEYNATIGYEGMCVTSSYLVTLWRWRETEWDYVCRVWESGRRTPTGRRLLGGWRSRPWRPRPWRSWSWGPRRPRP